ncbi:MAG: glutamate racemase [Candidatus Omnitrophota bacterium]
MNRPIGVFDSGIGGLTVVRELIRELPNEDIVYFGDTARVPYGTKSKATILKFSLENVLFLSKFKVKLIVIACNTSSALALQELKRNFRVPILGVIEPGARAAVLKTKNKKIGVIGTSATIASGAYEKAIKNIAKGARIFTQSCPLFVPLAEEGWTDNKVADIVTQLYLKPLKNKGIDTLILGCTHYPMFKNVIKKALGQGVALVDSAQELAKEANALLRAKGLANKQKCARKIEFYVSDEPLKFAHLGKKFLGRKIPSVKKANYNV